MILVDIKKLINLTIMDFNILIGVAHAAEAVAEAEKDTGMVGTLGINWKLFLAQLVNFGIILYILRRFVFLPISKKLEERSEKIEKALLDAEEVEKQKTEFEEWKKQELAKTRQEAADILAKAEADAGVVRDDLMKKTKADQEKIVAQAKDQIDSDQKKALAQIKSEVADLVTSATEKVLKKKLDDKHDMELIKKTLEELSTKKSK